MGMQGARAWQARTSAEGQIQAPHMSRAAAPRSTKQAALAAPEEGWAARRATSWYCSRIRDPQALPGTRAQAVRPVR